MKKLVELLLCILHPVAVFLIWLNLLFSRRDLGFIARLAWGVAVVVPFVPFLYVLTGNDQSAGLARIDKRCGQPDAGGQRRATDVRTGVCPSSQTEPARGCILVTGRDDTQPAMVSQGWPGGRPARVGPPAPTLAEGRVGRAGFTSQAPATGGASCGRR